MAEARRRKHHNLSTSVSYFYCCCSAADLELRVVLLRLAAGVEDWLGLLRRREGAVSAFFSLEAGDSNMAIVIVSFK